MTRSIREIWEEESPWTQEDKDFVSTGTHYATGEEYTNRTDHTVDFSGDYHTGDLPVEEQTWRDEHDYADGTSTSDTSSTSDGDSGVIGGGSEEIEVEVDTGADAVADALGQLQTQVSTSSIDGGPLSEATDAINDLLPGESAPLSEGMVAALGLFSATWVVMR